jgi:hypothetical protein
MTVVPRGKKLPDGLSLPSKTQIPYRLLEVFPFRCISLGFSLYLLSKVNQQIVTFFPVFSENVMKRHIQVYVISRTVRSERTDPAIFIVPSEC